MAEPVLVAWSGGEDNALAPQGGVGGERYRVVAPLTPGTAPNERISMHGGPRRLLHPQTPARRPPLEEGLVPRPPAGIRGAGIRCGVAGRPPGRDRPVRRERRVSHVRVRGPDATRARAPSTRRDRGTGGALCIL